MAFSIYSRANSKLEYSLLGARRLKPIRPFKSIVVLCWIFEIFFSFHGHFWSLVLKLHLQHAEGIGLKKTEENQALPTIVLNSSKDERSAKILVGCKRHRMLRCRQLLYPSTASNFLEFLFDKFVVLLINVSTRITIPIRTSSKIKKRTYLPDLVICIL